MKDGEIKAFIDRGQEKKQEFFIRILDILAKVTGGVSDVF